LLRYLAKLFIQFSFILRLLFMPWYDLPSDLEFLFAHRRQLYSLVRLRYQCSFQGEWIQILLMCYLAKEELLNRDILHICLNLNSRGHTSHRISKKEFYPYFLFSRPRISSYHQWELYILQEKYKLTLDQIKGHLVTSYFYHVGFKENKEVIFVESVLFVIKFSFLL